MDIRKDYRYYVVQFLDPPYCDIDQYVCIPDSWIQLREIADQVVVAKFPVENSSITKKRVKDGEVFSDDWSIYVAEVKYGTDSYEDAEKYIETLKEKLINEQNCSGLVDNGDRLSKTSKSLRRSKQIKSNLSVHKLQVSEALPNYNIEPVSEQLAVICTDVETSKKQTNRVETITSNSANEVIKQTNASSETLNGEQLFSNIERYLYEITVRQKNNDEKLNNFDSIENDNGPQGIAGNESPVTHDGPQLTNESFDAIIINEPFSDTGNPDQLKNASDSHFEEGFLLLIDRARNEYFKYCKVLEKLMDNINNHYYCGSYNPLKDAVAPVVEEKEREEKEIVKKDKWQKEHKLK